MHIISAMISTGVGASMFGASGVAAGVTAKKAKEELKSNGLKTAIAGAAVFSAQMVNFSIVGTGSSGHMGGGLLLSALLGGPLAFVSMSVILLVQCLIFGDGGLLALGCNIFNMGVIPCFLVYPLVKNLIKNKKTMFAGALLGGVLSMILGALAVFTQVMISGTSSLSAIDFLKNMVLIHIAIGACEGAITAIILYVADFAENKFGKVGTNGFLGGLALLTGAVFSIFASAKPDGLEWSFIKVTGSDEVEYTSAVHAFFDKIQDTTTLLPNYMFKTIDTPLGTAFCGVLGCVLVAALLYMISKTSKSRVLRED